MNNNKGYLISKLSKRGTGQMCTKGNFCTKVKKKKKTVTGKGNSEKKQIK